MEQLVRLGSTTASQASLLSQIRFTVPMWMELDTGFSIQDIDSLSKLHAIWVVGDGPIQSKWKTWRSSWGRPSQPHLERRSTAEFTGPLQFSLRTAKRYPSWQFLLQQAARSKYCPVRPIIEIRRFRWAGFPQLCWSQRQECPLEIFQSV